MKPVDEMNAWLFTVARNRITDLYRKKRPELLPEFIDDDEGDLFYDEIGRLLFEDGNTPETEFLRSLVWKELADALDDLPPGQRVVFELTEFEGLPFKKISEITRVPVNTLISRKRYAVLFIRKRLSIIYDELVTNKN